MIGAVIADRKMVSRPSKAAAGFKSPSIIWIEYYDTTMKS